MAFTLGLGYHPHPKPLAYKIVATIDSKSTAGLFVHDWFKDNGECLDQTYKTSVAALLAASQAYKGPDVDNVNVTWEVVEVDA